MSDYLLLHILVLGGLSCLFVYWRLAGRHLLFVRELCHRLGGKVTHQYGSVWDWKVVVLQLLTRNKQVIVEYRFRRIKSRDDSFLRSKIAGELEIRIPIVQKFWLRLLQQHQDEAPVNELVTGIPELDKLYVIHANQIEAASDFLKRVPVQERLLRFPIPLERLEIYKGFLKAVISQPFKQQVQREEFENTVNALLDIEDIYSYQQIGFVQIASAAGNPSCPYCRCLFDFEGETIVRCSVCGTSLHQQCWDENKQCTTWGCTSVTAK